VHEIPRGLVCSGTEGKSKGQDCQKPRPYGRHVLIKWLSSEASTECTG
jgi:hypothetical protein